MIWKIFFIIVAITSVLMGLYGENTDYKTLTNFDYFMGIWAEINMIFIMGLFYSLGWKQRIFSKKSCNIFFSIFMLSIAGFLLLAAFYASPEIYNLRQTPAVLAISVLITLFAMIIFVNIPLIPFYIGFYKYKKGFDGLEAVNKPYWKLFSMFSATALTSALINAAQKYPHYSSYNIFDFCCILSCVYEIVFLIGYSWNKKIFNKLFWKITSVPYVCLMCTTPFFTSETFNQDFQIFETITINNIVEAVLVVVLSVAYTIALFKYAFEKEPHIEQ